MQLVRVYSAENEMDAELIKSVLESEGIEAMIKSETYGRLLGGLVPSYSYGGMQVLVRAEDAERAKEIITDVRIEPDVTDEEDEDQEQEDK